jgi:ABC-2 type transport system ATP-binding protein
VRPTAGRAEVFGIPAGAPAARAALGYLAELFRFPGWCSADEVLPLHQKLTGSRGGAAERAELLELVGLSDATERRAMSKGMQQRLGIAQALVGGPRLLLLDEPTSALDPVGRRTVRHLLDGLRGRGVAVLLNSHLLSEMALVCDCVAIMLAGRIVAAGRPAELARAGGVEVETESGVRTFPGASREEVPDLVAGLVAAGERIYGVRVGDLDAGGGLPRGRPGRDRMTVAAPAGARGPGLGAVPVIIGYALRERACAGACSSSCCC